MNPADRLHHIRALFDRVVERPESEWLACLEQECASDPALKAVVMIPVPPQIAARKLRYVVFYANPMYGLISAYRKVLLSDFDNGWNPWSLVVSVVAAFVIFFLGIFYFRRTERRFADIA